jgi:hypothetical protein
LLILFSGPIKTVTDYNVKTITKNSTISTYVPTATAFGGLFPPYCRPARAISALGSLANDTAATACGCLGHRVPTTTTTLIITAAPVEVTSTAVDGSAPTTTIYHIVKDTTTVFVRPQKTTTKKTTTCITSTIYETYAAPTFTKVYGPKAGCADVAPGVPTDLPSSVASLPDATEACKDLCEQDPHCSFMYVQRLFSESDGKPFFGCLRSDKLFNPDTDLNCEPKQGVYGVALGFDAEDRGTEPLS